MTSSIRSVSIGVATAALAFAMAACSQTTYGTGTTPGMQTLQDLAGIADLGGPSKPPINYSARPGLVQPPPGTPLPAPGSAQRDLASNWPNDPDAQTQKFKEEVAAREKFCSDEVNKLRPECRDPGFRLTPQANASREPSPALANMGVTGAQAARSTPEQNAEAVKLFADAHSKVAVDANGKPIRRYLTDPPSDYRLPDPSAPVVFDKKPAQKKWRWPWEPAAPAADNLTPDASATTTGTPSSSTTGTSPPG